jgi:iron complex outermembrane receptor protein
VGAPAFASVNGYTTFDLALDWANIANKNVDLRFYMENVTDRRTPVTTQNQMPALGYASATYTQPRMFGAEVSWHF